MASFIHEDTKLDTLVEIVRHSKHKLKLTIEVTPKGTLMSLERETRGGKIEPVVTSLGGGVYPDSEWYRLEGMADHVIEDLAAVAAGSDGDD